MSAKIMELTGLNYIAGEQSGESGKIIKAVDPATAEEMEPEFYEASSVEIDRAILKANQAFKEYRIKSGREKALFLESIAEEILSSGDNLIDRCTKETGLGRARLTGERGRTVGQLRLFAGLLNEGSWVQASIETPLPDRKPVPRQDIRSMQISLGPVAVFGASNFPLAFSVAGGDTVSALAAGCPVVVKAHPAHPGTSEIVARAILNASIKTGMPKGVFSLIHGASNKVGQKLVTHPLIKAVAFTGSFRGGKALFDLANQREIPIPVYAEMGSTNPVFILPKALRENRDSIVKGLLNSVTLGVGQFCTNPGLVMTLGTNESEVFLNDLKSKAKNSQGGVMLTSTIFKAYNDGIEDLGRQTNIEMLEKGEEADTLNTAQLAIYKTNARNFLQNPDLETEIFGPSSLIVLAENKVELYTLAERLGGHLTATIFGTAQDFIDYKELIRILEQKAGRVIFNGFPTGVEVCHSMVHGGPFPATTDSRTTSVGTTAIYRFTRPVCYQDVHESFLPVELKSDNPLDIWRMIDGEFKK